MGLFLVEQTLPVLLFLLVKFVLLRLLCAFATFLVCPAFAVLSSQLKSATAAAAAQAGKRPHFRFAAA